MKIHIPTPLRSYTHASSVVLKVIQGCNVNDAIRDLDTRFPGLRFRIIDEQDQIREHIRIFINQDLVRDLLSPLKDSDELHIIAALSGG